MKIIKPPNAIPITIPITHLYTVCGLDTSVGVQQNILTKQLVWFYVFALLDVWFMQHPLLQSDDTVAQA
jgi:hypothetical protein